jgi:dolichol kinase
VPIGLTLVVAAATAAMPRVAAYNTLAARIVHSVSNGEEQWTGLVYYTLAYALFTALAVTLDPFPAGAALLALSLGDGIGGAVGRRFGRHRFQMPDAKVKSFEGSLAVLLAAAAGAWLAAAVLGRDVDALALILLGVVASLVEALAPRATDNVLIPIAVWTAATLVT